LIADARFVLLEDFESPIVIQFCDSECTIPYFSVAVFSIFLIFCFNIFSNVNYNVFVIMDNSAKQNVESISKGLKEVGIDSLYSKGYAIHMTLYLTEYKPEALKTIKETVNKIAKNTKPFEVNFLP